jgi:hypothetical protein
MGLPRIRISLRLFLLLTLLCAAVIGWFAATYLEPYRREDALLRRITAMKGQVLYVDRSPHWFWNLFGERIAQRASSIIIYNVKEFDDKEFAEVVLLNHLEQLILNRTSITNSRIDRLDNLTGLVHLELTGTSISQPPPVSRMPNLITLNLMKTNVTSLDASGLNRLEYLGLAETEFNDDSLAALAPLPRLKTLDLTGSMDRRMFSDKGIAHLSPEKFPNLTRIYLRGTNVTEVGIANLQARFPGAGIYAPSMTTQAEATIGPAKPATSAR